MLASLASLVCGRVGEGRGRSRGARGAVRGWRGEAGGRRKEAGDRSREGGGWREEGGWKEATEDRRREAEGMWVEGREGWWRRVGGCEGGRGAEAFC